MKSGDILIAIVWVSILASAFISGIDVGHLKRPPGTVAPFPPLEFALVALLLFFSFCSTAAFFSQRRLSQRRRVYDVSWLRTLIDWKWGVGTFYNISVRLKPLSLMMLWCLSSGIVGLASTYANEQDWYAYFTSAFFLSCGLGLLVGQLLSYRFPRNDLRC
jgi:hypothetical protein